MQLIGELMEAKKAKRIPYDEFMIERDRIEKAFDKAFNVSGSSGFGIDRQHLWVEVAGSVSHKFGTGSLPRIPVKIGKVFGDFNMDSSGLESLENGPFYVHRDFSIPDNKLTTLKHGPDYVGGNYIAYNNKLTSLEGAPEELHGILNVKGNPLTSLKGIPKIAMKGYILLPYDHKRPLPLLRLPTLRLTKVLFSPDDDVEDDVTSERAKKLAVLVNAQLNKGRKGVLELQKQLGDNDFVEWARYE